MIDSVAASPVDRLLAERACERVIIESAAANDRRDWSGFARLFTADGTVRRPNGSESAGTAAIEASYAAAPGVRRTQHVCTNIRVDVTDAGHASASTTVMIFSWLLDDVADDVLPTIGTPALGRFADDLVREDDEWRIQRRVATLLARP